MSSANVSVFVDQGVAYIRVGGRANFACSPDFKKLLEELTDKGFTRYVIELQSCVLMDSTFLGVLAGFGIKLNSQNANGATGERSIELFNATDRVKELLENLGAVDLFILKTGELQPPANTTARQPESINPTHEQIARTSLEAHETLMKMNPDNVARFKDVTQFLAEDLKNIAAASK